MNTPNPKQNGNPMTQQINEALDAKRNARHELWAAIKFLHETQVLTAEEALEGRAQPLEPVQHPRLRHASRLAVELTKLSAL